MAVPFSRIQDIYGLADPAVALQYTVASRAAVAAQPDPLVGHGFVVTDAPAPSTATDVSLAFAAVGVALVSAYGLVLDGPTLAAILDGRITRWLDPAIVALNPNGLTDTFGANLTDRNQTIVLLRGPVGAVEALAPILRSYDGTYSGAAILAARSFSMDSMLLTAIVGIPYSLAVTTFIGSYTAELAVVQFQRSDGIVLRPSLATLQACASSDAFAPSSHSFLPWLSQSTACYPLGQAVYLRVRKSRCDNATDAARTRTAAFVEWLFSGEAVDAVLKAQGVVPLRPNPWVAAANAAALDVITCNPKAPPGNDALLFIIVGAAVGAFVLLGAAAGGWGWHSTKELRAMRRQFSNDNVAQECAAAIAGVCRRHRPLRPGRRGVARRRPQPQPHPGLLHQDRPAADGGQALHPRPAARVADGREGRHGQARRRY
eukprot:EG_transcript_8274